MAELGWHLQLWIDARDLPDLLPELAQVPAADRGRSHGPAWSIVTARTIPASRRWCAASAKAGCGRRCRAPIGWARTPPDYLEAKPFHDALVAANPNNLVWGTDWPHPRPEGPVPDAAHLLDVFLDWTPSPAVRKAILTDNPARLYDFPPA